MALQTLHQIGIVHGDLEPRNVMKTQDGVYKLIDFSDSAVHKCPETQTVRRVCDV